MASPDQLLHLAKNWDFSQGRKFQNEVLNKLQSSVHHPSSSPYGSFFLLATFRRYTFRLTEGSVSLALHSCLGGTPAGFHVVQEGDRHFRFSVASKNVGFLVYSLKRIITDYFDVYFHLWRDGGANWKKERKQWLQEEKESWTHVSYQKKKMNKKRVSFAKNLIQSSPTQKSRPSELESVIKIGSFYCPFPSPMEKMVFGAQPPVHVGQIPVKKIFKSLRHVLGINPVFSDRSCIGSNPLVGQSGSSDVEKKVNARASKQCFKCLAWGHIISECTSRFRCKICFGYNHLAKRCFKRKIVQKQNWVPKIGCPIDAVHVVLGPEATETNSSGSAEDIDGMTTSPRSNVALHNSRPLEDPRPHGHADVVTLAAAADPSPLHLPEKDLLDSPSDLVVPLDDVVDLPAEPTPSKASAAPITASPPSLLPRSFDVPELEAFLDEGLELDGFQVEQRAAVQSSTAAPNSGRYARNGSFFGKMYSRRRNVTLRRVTSRVSSHGSCPAGKRFVDKLTKKTCMILPSPSNFEFQEQNFQPSPVGQRKSNSREASMALPVTIGNITTPLVDSTVRRSIRRSNITGGFKEVRPDKEPSKKRKGNIIQIDGNTGSSAPIPVDILQGWGIDCGVPPAELSLEALMQAPLPNQSVNEYT